VKALQTRSRVDWNRMKALKTMGRVGLKRVKALQTRLRVDWNRVKALYTGGLAF